MICEYCNKEHDGTYASGRFCSRKCAHSRIQTKEQNLSRSLKLKGNSACAWNKGQTKYPVIFLICIYCGNKFETRNPKRKFCNDSCAAKFYNWPAILNNNKKAYENGRKVSGGTTKWLLYKNIKVQGTYELRACKILDFWKQIKKIKNWEYTNDRFDYEFEGKIRKYLLDFKIFENDGNFYYIEVKGYKKSNDDAKWKAVADSGYKLEVWFEQTLEKFEEGL
jgi:hypothetical protein